MKKQIIIAVVITALICITGTSYATYKLMAQEVSFDNNKTSLNSDNVQDSIDEIVDLIRYGDAESSDILNGKTALVKGKKITGTYNTSKTATLTVSYGTGDAGQGYCSVTIGSFSKEYTNFDGGWNGLKKVTSNVTIN